MIVAAAFEAGKFVAAGVFLFLLAVIFVGMAMTILSVVYGKPSVSKEENKYPDRIRSCAPIMLFLVIVCVLGVYIPPPLRMLVDDAVQFLQAAR